MRNRDLQTGLLIPLFVLLIPFGGASMARMVRTGARPSALSLAVVAVPGAFAVFHNQALLTEEKLPSIGLSYSNPFFISGYYENSLSLVCPLRSEVVAMSLSQSGVADYRESSIGIALAKNLSGKLAAGIHLNYFDLSLPEAGRHKGSFQADAGVRLRLSGNLLFGLHFSHLASSSIETMNYHVVFPLIIRGGASCRLTERILLAGESIYERMAGIGFRVGTEYNLRQSYWIRAGIATNPFQHSFGFGYRMKNFQLDFALVHHEILGFSPVFSIDINLK